MEYVNVYGAVPSEPVNVIEGEDAFWHTAVVPERVADGNGLTVIVAEPDAVFPHEVLLASVTLRSE
jgi:hypothetical protein